ncbi:riboflavin synthase subunit alpha [Blattabacterium sp. (Blattella germanica) str. Bge]|uniref:riboflavin synthase n=1 Tax=Blattabacterium sp. (Blattella germanica) TaxID=624186 RepID=UPI0001BB62ED|nr:riboflavin synthase [Blattabacterium sp. (Blattella germanica)]ACY40109.1 riboflavin synthase subunit alpha [Blattabacterium sp. (Blattella germanica) str. Bge]
MFTGIVECTTKVYQLNRDQKNLCIIFMNPFSNEIKINQSICHNGICFTIINFNEKTYSVIASEETFLRTNLNFLKIKDEVNLERGLMMFERLNGHIVQGHVDTTAQIIQIENRNGSWLFFLDLKKELNHTVVEKGSIAINGISLTVVTCNQYIFSVSIIPYTYHKTNLHLLKVGDVVNVEFDILGKYISKSNLK